LKPAVLRPQALRDQQGEVRYYRKEGGTRVAVKVAKATNDVLGKWPGFRPGGRLPFFAGAKKGSKEST
jgi:hypothetical protein